MSDGLESLSLDELISELQKARKKAGKNIQVRYADGYDNALSIYCVSFEEDTGWDGDPDEKFVALS
jgi:hypothetical protein